MIDLFKDLAALRHIFARQDKWKFAVLFCLMLLGSILEAVGIGAVPAFVTLVMNPSSLIEYRWIGAWFSGMPEQITVALLLWASGILLCFVVLKNLFLTFVFYVQTRIVTSQRVKLTDRMFEIYQAAPYEWHLQRSSSDLLRSIQVDTAQVLGGVIMPFLNLLMAVIMAAVIIVVMILSTPGVTLLALLVTGCGLFLVMQLFQKKLRDLGWIFRRETKELMKAIQQGFGSLVDSRMLGCEKYLSEIHRKSLQRWAKAEIHKQTIQKATPYALELFSVLGLLIILILLVESVQRSHSLGEILPIVALLGVAMIRLKQLASQIAGSINQMNAARVHIPAILNDLRELEAIEHEYRTAKLGRRIIKHFESMSLENLSYTYPDQSKPTIRDVSLKLQKGESIGFIGSTGCGKSTLVNLILGFLNPQTGRILVNDIEVQSDLNGWRALIGYVPQYVYLLDDTVWSNVAFGLPRNLVDENQLWKALEAACLAEFAVSLPQGLDSVIGERGVRLSGGQRQRLGIARALYRDPEFLVMDEATSSLDSKTEAKVMRAVLNAKKERTCIMVTHRLTTVRKCNRLYFVQDGRIAHQGPFEELRRTSSTFREMIAKYETEAVELEREHHPI